MPDEIKYLENKIKGFSYIAPTNIQNIVRVFWDHIQDMHHLKIDKYFDILFDRGVRVLGLTSVGRYIDYSDCRRQNDSVVKIVDLSFRARHSDTDIRLRLEKSSLYAKSNFVEYTRSNGLQQCHVCLAVEQNMDQCLNFVCSSEPRNLRLVSFQKRLDFC